VECDLKDLKSPHR